MSSRVTTDATREHIDAERLAAWADHGLPPAAAAEVELHLSQCEHCQEVLAAFVRSEPMPAVVIPFWARPPVRWSAAGLAAAAALFLMVRTGPSPTAPVHESTVATAPSVSPVPDDELRRERQSSVASRDAKSTMADSAEQKRATRKEQAAGMPAAPAPPPPAALPPTVQAAVPPPQPVGVAAATRLVAPPQAPPAAGRVAGGIPAMAELVMLDASRGVFEISAPGPAGAGGRIVAGGAAGRGAAAASELRQQSAPARWRITGGVRVEHSLDGGATWTVLPIEPALTTPVVAGAAASQSVCWLVGLEGVVLVTTDGRTFRRASLPERVELVSVTVEDGLRATVTAADGRKFSTVDGGLTWK